MGKGARVDKGGLAVGPYDRSERAIGSSRRVFLTGRGAAALSTCSVVSRYELCCIAYAPDDRRGKVAVRG